MRQIAAIALLALRTTFRSRVVLVLSALLFVAAFLLPGAIRGDGTPEGLVRLHLTYSLGIAGFLLALSNLWAGCAAVSQEADDKTLQLLLVKPVPRFRIWLGKWLALLLVNALLLALVGTVVAVALHAKLLRGGFEAEALAAARQTTLASLQTLRAPLPDVEAAVRAEYESLRARGQLPENIAANTILDSIRRTQLARLYSIAPGASLSWSFALPPVQAKRSPGVLVLQCKADSSVPGAADIQTAIELHAGDQTLARELRAMPGTVQTLVFSGIPADARQADVVVHNHGTHDATLFFDPSEGLVLRQPDGTFAGNYLRALLQLFLRLALFAAIGITLGTLFSMPVASFLALVLILILQLSGFIASAAQVDRATFVANVAPFAAPAHAHGEEQPPAAEPSFLARAAANVFYYAYRGTYLTLRPLLEDRTIDALATGTCLPPRALARNLLHQGLLLPLVLGLLATAVLRRREWARPNIN